VTMLKTAARETKFLQEPKFLPDFTQSFQSIFKTSVTVFHYTDLPAGKLHIYMTSSASGQDEPNLAL